MKLQKKNQMKPIQTKNNILFYNIFCYSLHLALILQKLK